MMSESGGKLTSPTDWPESWQELRRIDNLLRCSICCEFFDHATIIPACSHTYCSLCIRRYLATESKCPSCPTIVNDTQIKNNRVIDELVKSFLNLRDQLLKVVKDSKSSDGFSSASALKRQRKGKCSTSDQSSSNEMSSPVCRKRLKRLSNGEDTADESDDEISIIEPPATQQSPTASSSGSQAVGKVEKKGLVECPVCGQTIAASKINIHLDTCLTSKDRKGNLRSTSSQSSCSADQNTDEVSSAVGANAFIPQVAKRKPLNKLVYTLLSDKKLKERLKKHGLSIKGDRKTLVKRHQEFTLLYNSECNKPRPKPESEIVRLVEEGEKNKKKLDHGRQKLNFDRGQSQEDMDKVKDEYTDVGTKSPRKGTTRQRLTPSKKKNNLLSKNISSDEETSSNSSVDFEIASQRFNTPRRKSKLIAATAQRRMTSCGGIQVSRRSSSVQAKNNVLDNGCGDSKTTSLTVPDAPSPSLLNNLGGSDSDQSTSDSTTLLPAFDQSSPIPNDIQSTTTNDAQCESEEFEF